MRKKPESKEVTFLSDDSSNTDIGLSSSQLIVWDKILNIVRYSSGQSVAVTGGWGSGKTLIINKVKLETKDEVLWIPFFPWAYTNEAALISDFYRTITSELDRVSHRLTIEGNQLGRSIQRLIKSDNLKGPIAGLATFIMDIFNRRMEPEEIIAERLKRLNKKIVILIDDLERVSNKKVINRTLQLVHHLKRVGITKVTFITMFERNSVINSLPSHIESTEKDYFIEKFFDIEIILPDPLNLDIQETLEGMIPSEPLPFLSR
jgi:predicted KAP-like P-loop ATPase